MTEKNLNPANIIFSKVSSTPIENSSYPILIEGKALPHSKQLKSANKIIV